MSMLIGKRCLLLAYGGYTEGRIVAEYLMNNSTVYICENLDNTTNPLMHIDACFVTYIYRPLETLENVIIPPSFTITDDEYTEFTRKTIGVYSRKLAVGIIFNDNYVSYLQEYDIRWNKLKKNNNVVVDTVKKRYPDWPESFFNLPK